MVKRIQGLSILVSLVLVLQMANAGNVFANQVIGTHEKQPEKLIFCTFEQGTTNVSYTPQAN